MLSLLVILITSNALCGASLHYSVNGKSSLQSQTPSYKDASSQINKSSNDTSMAFKYSLPDKAVAMYSIKTSITKQYLPFKVKASASNIFKAIN